MTIKPVAWLRKDRFKAIEANEKESWIESGHGDVVEDYTIPCYEGSKIENKVYIGFQCYYNGCEEFRGPHESIRL